MIHFFVNWRSNTLKIYIIRRNRFVVVKFVFIESSKSKNINQSNVDLTLELFAIDIFKKKENFEIVLLFSKNGIITLSTEVIDVTLEDQKIENYKSN